MIMHAEHLRIWKKAGLTYFKDLSAGNMVKSSKTLSQ
jgi:hypothetical protein